MSSEIRLEVLNGGQILLDGEPVSMTELAAQLSNLKVSQPDVRLHTIANLSATYAQVAPVLKAVQDAGLGLQGFISSGTGEGSTGD